MTVYSKSICTLLTIFFLNNATAQEIDTLVDVGNYKLHFNISKGKGVPILFESGAGNDGSIWDSIVKPLHDSLGTILIRYDRAGFGKSEIDTSNLNVISEIMGLEIALGKLGFRNKLFVVAHSLGGNYAMVLNQRNNDKIIGGVLIDNPTPCFMTNKKAQEVKKLYWDDIEEIKRQSLGFYYILKNYEFTSKVMRDASHSMTMPLTIICSDSTPFEGKERDVWKECMRNFAKEVKNRKFIMAEKCSHHVFLDNPSLVIDAIIRQYRNSTRKFF